MRYRCLACGKHTGVGVHFCGDECERRWDVRTAVVGREHGVTVTPEVAVVASNSASNEAVPASNKSRSASNSASNKQRWSREAYNTYMREYMRRKRHGG